ncbi:MAG TPA: 4-hydroxybenzoate octaprenyltransferase [Burkholderiales bacterium]|nr:4-hydroxybenzoate octaprenyltransferase [Burkholderiales bacterium]
MDLALVARKLDAYERLVRLDKPIGTLLLLWPTLWAVWLASYGHPTFTVVVVFGVGTLLMRSAGCAVNDFADRRFDPHVERTRTRPLAAGEIGPGEALAVGAVLAGLAFVLVLFLNRFAILLSVLALAIAATYPFTKRFFSLPQAYLGIAFGFGIPMAYAAVLNRLPLDCWALLGANVCWAIAYDTEYAMVDREDDRKIGIRTAALTLGRFDVAAVMVCYGATIAILAWVGRYLHLRWPYYAGLAVAAALIGYHYFLIRGRSREGCFRAFRHNNWVGAAIFAGIALSYALPLSGAHWR